MDAVTYPDKNVIEFTNHNVIPLRIPSNTEPLASEFILKWTPTLIILDEEGKERARTIGFLTPEEFAPTMFLGIAKAHYERDRFKKALAALDTLITKYPQSDAAPEAIFYRGVCGYKSTHNPKPLKDAYTLLSKEYPGNMWTKRALPYRLLP